MLRSSFFPIHIATDQSTNKKKSVVHSSEDDSTLLGEQCMELTNIVLYYVLCSSCADTRAKLDPDDLDIPLTKASITPPRLSPVGRILHAMSSWCTSDTWDLLRKRIPEGLEKAGGKSGSEYLKIEEEKTPGNEQRKELKNTPQPLRSVEGEEYRIAEFGIGGFLPAVHSSSQSQLQMGIFLQQLKRRYST